MVSLSLPIELLVSILNTYLRSKYHSLCDFCEYENLDYEELISKLSNNSYQYVDELNQIKPIN